MAVNFDFYIIIVNEIREVLKKVVKSSDNAITVTSVKTKPGMDKWTMRASRVYITF